MYNTRPTAKPSIRYFARRVSISWKSNWAILYDQKKKSI
jgi:hypothetical protein